MSFIVRNEVAQAKDVRYLFSFFFNCVLAIPPKLDSILKSITLRRKDVDRQTPGSRSSYDRNQFTGSFYNNLNLFPR